MLTSNLHQVPVYQIPGTDMKKELAQIGPRGKILAFRTSSHRSARAGSILTLCPHSDLVSKRSGRTAHQ